MCFHLFDEFGYYALLNISNWAALMKLMKMNWTGQALYLESSLELLRIVVPIYSLLIL
jgi:hypothetical protein